MDNLFVQTFVMCLFIGIWNVVAIVFFRLWNGQDEISTWKAELCALAPAAYTARLMGVEERTIIICCVITLIALVPGIFRNYCSDDEDAGG